MSLHKIYNEATVSITSGRPSHVPRKSVASNACSDPVPSNYHRRKKGRDELAGAFQQILSWHLPPIKAASLGSRDDKLVVMVPPGRALVDPDVQTPYVQRHRRHVENSKALT